MSTRVSQQVHRIDNTHLRRKHFRIETSLTVKHKRPYKLKITVDFILYSEKISCLFFDSGRALTEGKICMERATDRLRRVANGVPYILSLCDLWDKYNQTILETGDKGRGAIAKILATLFPATYMPRSKEFCIRCQTKLESMSTDNPLVTGVPITILKTHWNLPQ